jgi:hypothetical protein
MALILRDLTFVTRDPEVLIPELCSCVALPGFVIFVVKLESGGELR